MMKIHKVPIESYLEQIASRHKSLCPRQVLGARIGLAGAEVLGMDVPQADKHMLVIVETDGCFVDGIEITTGCSVGHRTMRVEDYGKVAATFVQVDSSRAIRVAPRLDVRDSVWAFARDEKTRYQAMLKGYQLMPTEELLSIQKVILTTPIESIISHAGVRENCQQCGEEIMNEREVLQSGRTLCQACAGSAYYQSTSAEEFVANLLSQNPSHLTVTN